MTGMRKIAVCPFCFSASIFRRARYPRDYKCNLCKRTFKVPGVKEHEMRAPVPKYLRPKTEVIQ